jgi:uncharacterized protein (UPF0335 family)
MTDNTTEQRLLSLIERIERMTEEKQEIQNDIKEIYSEAKGAGFDVKTLKLIVKLRKLDSEKRAEAQGLLETYANAIGLEHAFIE